VKVVAAGSFSSNMSVDQEKDEEELMKMFNAHLNLGEIPRPASLPAQVAFHAPSIPLQQQPDRPVYYASVHYTHSAHLKPRSHAQVLEALRLAGIDPNGLSQEQVNLLLTCPDVEFHQLFMSSPSISSHQMQQMKQQQQTPQLQLQQTSPPPVVSVPDLYVQDHDGQSTSTMDTDIEQAHLGSRLSPPPRPVSSPGVLYVEAPEPYMTQGYSNRLPPELGYCSSAGSRRNVSVSATDPAYLGSYLGGTSNGGQNVEDMHMDM
jgi:hypothetical protein